MSHTLDDLAEHLLEQLPGIVDRWHRSSLDDPMLLSVSQVARSAFRNNIPAAIAELCRVLSTGVDETPSDDLCEAVEKHGHHRWKQGFSLKQLIRDWGHLNEVLQATINDFFHARGQGNSPDRDIALLRLSRYMTDAATGSVNQFDQLRQAQAGSVTRDLETMKAEFARLSNARANLLRASAHDIKGGLSAMTATSDVIRLSTIGDSALGEMLDLLDRSVGSLNLMIDALLDLSRLESGAESVRLCSCNVAKLLSDVVDRHKPSAERKHLQLRKSGPDNLEVRTDPGKVERIAQNLIVNALKYTATGDIAVGWSRSDQRWLLRISDTGPGIQPVAGSPIARQLNDPDSDTVATDRPSFAYAGEGIGLTIVRQLCELLDAGISLESTLGAGSTFTIDFPTDYPSESQD